MFSTPGVLNPQVFTFHAPGPAIKSAVVTSSQAVISGAVEQSGGQTA